MSLSSLGRQIAALNAPGRNLGSALPSSTRHEDAVGRGLAHSVHTGHSTYAKSHLHKPSIIYEDSKKAADVPLTTIRENCIASLRLLEEDVDPEFGTFVSTLCKDGAGGGAPEERGLLTYKDNEQVDKIIQDLLFRLSLRLNSKNTITPCLHVMEYLLRRYDIHARPTTASTTLLATLPCHEEPFFLRLLQLIDLASMPTWSFLRPHAAPGATTAVPRTVIAKQLAKDTSLLREICRLSQRNSKLPNSSQSLSFTAAVLVEAMTLQMRQSGSMSERTCRAILPPVMSACRQTSSVLYQNWGHVVASSIVETSVLAEEPRNVLVTSILQGIAGNKSNSVVMNGLVLVLTILAQPLDGIDLTQYQLPIIQSSRSSSSSLPLQSLRGYPMDKPIFHALLKVDDLALRLGRLHADERIVTIFDWVASILVVAWKKLTKGFKKKEGGEGDLKSSKTIKRQKAIRKLLLHLMSEPKMLSLWKSRSAALIVSFTSFVVQHSDYSVGCLENKSDGQQGSDPVDTVETDEDTTRVVLEALRRMDAGAYDEGVAHALISTKSENRRQLASWLGLKSSKHSDDSQDSTGFESDLCLPPRVALEHAVKEVRLEAIPRVLEEFDKERMEVDNTDGDATINDGREELLETLFRRFSVEDDEDVAIATGEAICEVLRKYEITAWDPHVAETSLQALYKWTEVGGTKPGLKTSLLSLAISLASRAARALETGELYVRLIEAIGGHSVGSGDQLRQDAIAGLFTALSTNQQKAAKKSKLAQVNAFLVSNRTLLDGFCRSVSSRVSSTERALRRRFVTLMLNAWNDCLEQNQKKKTDKSLKFASDSIDYCLWTLKFLPDDMTEIELDLISACLNHSSKQIASNEELLLAYISSLAAESGDTFDKVAAPFIEEVCRNVNDSNGKSVPAVAVLMEIALSAGSSWAVENLLTIAARCVGPGDAHDFCYAVLPALALLQHSDSAVRAKAVDMLCLLGGFIEKETDSQWNPLNSICQFVSKQRSKATIGDESIVAKCLASSIRDSDSPSDAQNFILKLCVFSAAGTGGLETTSSEHAFKDCWLTTRPAYGGLRVAAIILNAAEVAGEAAFPLLLRWKRCGQIILDGLYAMKFSITKIPQQLEEIIDSVVRILKGVKVMDSSSLNEATPNIIISTGPATRGGRARSYSVGKSDGLVFLEPYPKDMQKALIRILSPEGGNHIMRSVRNAVFQIILNRHSWGQGVFARLTPAVRRAIAAAVLKNVSHHLADNADRAIYSLPMDALDVGELMTSEGDRDNASLSLLADYVSENSKTLATANGVNDLVSVLFRLISELSTETFEDVDEIDFVRQSMVEALRNVIRDSGEVPGAASVDDQDTFVKFKSLLIRLVGGSAEEFENVRPLSSLRAKLATLSLLAQLCSKDPKRVVSLIPAMLGSTMVATDSNDARSAFEVFSIVLPVFIRGASSTDLSLAHLFGAFAAAIDNLTSEDNRLSFSMSFIRALLRITDVHLEAKFSLVGGLVSCFLAREVYESCQKAKLDDPDSKSSRLVTRILEACDAHTQLEAVLSLAVFAKNIMIMLNTNMYSGTGPALLPVEHLEKIALEGPASGGWSPSKLKSNGRNLSSGQRHALMRLCQSFLLAASDCLASDALRKFVRNSDGADSNVSLRLWQNLLLVQSSCFVNTSGNGNNEEGFLWKVASDLANDSLECLQSDLPCHIFLASASSLIKEGGTGELRARAVRLIADRALQVQASSPEASLFRDMLPFLVDLLQPSTDSSSSQLEGNPIVLQQSALVGIENIARVSWVSSGETKNWAAQFTEAMSVCGNILNALSGPFHDNPRGFSGVDGPSRQLICSAALCASTLVRVCGPKSIPTLPILMEALVRSLCAANGYAASSTSNDDDDCMSEAKMMQLSILRSLVAVTDTLPQFLGPFLKQLLSPSALPSEGLRTGSGEHENAIRVTIERLEDILATRVPPRQLIPAASSCLIESPNSIGLSSLLATLNAAVKASSGANLSSQRAHILRAATFAFEFQKAGADRQKLTEVTTDLLLNLILKLSEVQLRQLYGKLRDWKGDLDKADPHSRVLRRAAFWKLSARLGKELRSIFLPCLSSVFTDAVDELVSGQLLSCISEMSIYPFATIGLPSLTQYGLLFFSPTGARG